MSLLSRPLVVDGNTWGTIYTLEKAGDEFPTHVHSEADNHITALIDRSLVPVNLLGLQDEIHAAQDASDIERFLSKLDHDEQDAADISDLIALLDDRNQRET